MGEFSLGVQPDTSSNTAPAPAEGIVFTQVMPGFRVDHAFEQGVLIRAAIGHRLSMCRGVAGLRIGFDHSVEYGSPDEHEASARVASRDEAVPRFKFRSLTWGAYVAKRR